MSAVVSLPSPIPCTEKSLLRLPLVKMMLEDPCVDLVPRAIDHHWSYQAITPSTGMGGFNFGTGAVHVADASAFQRWFKNPVTTPVRAVNEDDRLIREVLFATHDYLHVWAYRVVRAACPQLDFGAPPEDPATLDDHVFCHLVTEAVATVGLDYWYLSTIDLNDVLDIGTSFTTLTTPYHERQIREYRRWQPDFVAQEPKFFTTIANAYCRGTFHGFKARDVFQSPLLLKWMQQELTYGRKQRSYAREWFAYIGGFECEWSQRELEAPILTNKSWQRELLQDVSMLLWEKVKHGAMISLPTGPLVDKERLDRLPTGPIDFRFVNANRIDVDDPRLMSRTNQRPDSIDSLLRQLIARRRFSEDFDADVFRRALETRDIQLVKALLGSTPMLDADEDEEPRLLFLLS